VSRVISVSNHKGGVGKTTISANVGFSLARYFKILLIDIDPQCNLSTGLGINDCNENIGNYIKEIIHLRSPEVVPTEINNYVHTITSNCPAPPGYQSKLPSPPYLQDLPDQD
jgi:chromosome partitioning protein